MPCSHKVLWSTRGASRRCNVGRRGGRCFKTILRTSRPIEEPLSFNMHPSQFRHRTCRSITSKALLGSREPLEALVDISPWLWLQNDKCWALPARIKAFSSQSWSWLAWLSETRTWFSTEACISVNRLSRLMHLHYNVHIYIYMYICMCVIYTHTITYTDVHFT